jgi:hypothetical protein
MISFLKKRFDTVVGTIVGGLVYAASVCFLGASGLALSYFLFSSPAWTADYGFALSPQELSSLPIREMSPEKLGAFLENGHSPLEGMWIELMRLLLLGVVFVFLACRVFNNIAVGAPKAFTGPWFRSMETKVLGSIFVILMVGLLMYHLILGPDSLAHGSKYWHVFRTTADLWRLTPSPLEKSFWVDQFVKVGAAQVTAADFDAVMYQPLYRTPYLGYILYSVSTFVLLTGPALIIALRGLRHSTNWARSKIAVVRELCEERASLECIRRAVSESIAALLQDAERYSWAIFAVGILAWYEALLGYRTLAVLAEVSTVFTFVIFCAAIGLPLGTLFNYADMHQKVRTRYPELSREELPHPVALASRPKGIQSIVVLLLAAGLTWSALSITLANGLAAVPKSKAQAGPGTHTEVERRAVSGTF